MFRYLVLAAALGSGSLAHAGTCNPLQPDRLGLLLGSYHVDAQEAFEEFNPGLFAIWDCDLVNLRLGIHRNSFGEAAGSISFASEFLALRGGGFNAQPFIGTAYFPEHGAESPASIGGTDFILLAGLDFTHDDLPIFISYLPGDPEQAGYENLWTFGFRFQLR